jgi:quinol monooxygenase YgiN
MDKEFAMYLALVDFPVTDRAAAAEILARDCAHARAMPGNLDYRALTDAETVDRVVILHRWTDKAAFDAYGASELFREMGGALRALMSGPPVSLRLRAEEDEIVTG